jgi:ribosomal protein L7/L12
MSRDNPIRAIKLYRERTGAGLKEAKEAVERLRDGQPLEVSTPVPTGNAEVWMELARSGQKIQAIKAYREASGASLKDAKEAVERFMGVPPGRSGCVGSVVWMLGLAWRLFAG